jgi:thiosulfate/3-mercaptopyruvate sulfurtransferase
VAKFLVSCAELTGMLGVPSIRVVDMRWPAGNGQAGFRQYLRGRIPGAAYLGFDATQAPDPAVTGRAPDPADLAGALAGIGVGDATTVVAYDDNHQFTAARLVWLMRAHGHRRVFRLDGGWPAWIRSGAPMETGDPGGLPPAVRPPLLGATGSAIADLDAVRAHQAAGLPIVDCRRDPSWAEDPRLIPGATRLPVRALMDPSGRFLAPSDIKAVAGTAGIDADRPLIAYCGAAISAAAVWLALNTAGITGVRVYDGSIGEWIAGGLPVLTPGGG